MENRNLRANQVAAILNTTTRHIHNLVSAGHFEIFKIGERGLRITEKSVKEFVERRKNLANFERGVVPGAEKQGK